MTLSNTDYRRLYAGDGATVNFPIPFRFEADDDLNIRLFSADGQGAQQNLGQHYSASGEGDASGGTLSMISAPESGQTLLIERVSDGQQNLDLVTGGALSADSLETAFDRLVMAAQEQAGEANRAIRLHPLDADTDMTLPRRADRGDTVILFNSAGDGLVAGPAAADISSAQTYATAAGTAQGLSEVARDASIAAQGLSVAAQGAAETAEINAETAQGLAEEARDAAVAASEHMAYSYSFDSGTSDTDPGAAALRFNNAVLTSATEMYINEVAEEGDLSALMAIWDDSSSVIKATVRIRNPTAPTNWFEFYVTGNITDGGSYRKVPIQSIAANGAIASGASILLQITRNGDAGTGAVDSFNGRAGSVTPAASDYDASQIDNDSAVAGAKTSDALNTLNSSKIDAARTITAGTGLTGGGDLSADRSLNVDVGSGANQIPQLDGTGKLPALDGSQLTNLPSGGATRFTSALQSLTSAGVISVAHGLGVSPLRIGVFYVCTTAEFGFAVDTKLKASSFWWYSTNVNSAWADDTNVYLAHEASFYMKRRADGTGGALTPANWKAELWVETGIDVAVPVATTRFKSSPLTFAAESRMETTHPLGAAPDSVWAMLRCTDAEHDYAVGDVVPHTSDNGTAEARAGGNATRVWLLADYNGKCIPHFTTRNRVAITASKWEVILYAELWDAKGNPVHPRCAALTSD